jgi:hypothetical protein
MAQDNNSGKSRLVIIVVTVVATFLLMAFLVGQMVKVAAPPAVDATRAAARAKDNQDIRAGGIEALENWGYANKDKGLVRMPIAEAMKVTIQAYQKPAEFRADLKARAEKAAAPAPKPPEKPSEFE